MAKSDDKETPQAKPLVWMASSKRDLKRMPKSVRLVFGQAIYDAQTGKKHPDAKPLRGFGGAGVLEVVEDDQRSTYRAVYTVQYAGVVYVLHAFQKKSKTGSKTPAAEMDKVRARLKEAEKNYAERKSSDENKS